jgi:adenylate cyclase class IV
MRNIESKFAHEDHDAVLTRALSLGASDEGILTQTDYFYEVARGRLKLRVEDGRGTLIAYDREDRPEARESEYFISAVADPESMRLVLDSVLDSGPSISKRRHLLLLRHTRIHLDEIADLGRFVELETVLDDKESWNPHEEHGEVVEALGLADAPRLAGAYVDLFPRDSR